MSKRFSQQVAELRQARLRCLGLAPCFLQGAHCFYVMIQVVQESVGDFLREIKPIVVAKISHDSSSNVFVEDFRFVASAVRFALSEEFGCLSFLVH
jgi:hypothetical protein